MKDVWVNYQFGKSVRALSKNRFEYIRDLKIAVSTDLRVYLSIKSKTYIKKIFAYGQKTFYVVKHCHLQGVTDNDLMTS